MPTKVHNIETLHSTRTQRPYKKRPFANHWDQTRHKRCNMCSSKHCTDSTQPSVICLSYCTLLIRNSRSENNYYKKEKKVLFFSFGGSNRPLSSRCSSFITVKLVTITLTDVSPSRWKQVTFKAVSIYFALCSRPFKRGLVRRNAPSDVGARLKVII